MAEYDVTLESSEINVTLVLERTVNAEGGGSGPVDWDDIEDKPATFPPSAHNHDDRYYTESETDALLATKSDTSHNHDSRYYTETETNTLLNAKADLVGGTVPTAQLPSYVDDVIEAANFAALPVTGETTKIYVTIDDNKAFRWSGSAYVEISASLTLGETPATAYRGDRGKTAYDHSQATGNPHGATQDDIGDGSTYKQYSQTEKTKLAGIATGATANDTDANLKARANHTGTQALSTIAGVTASEAEINILDGATLSTTELNYVDGVTSAIQTQLNAKATDSDVVHDTGAETIAGVKTFSDDPIIPDEAYGSGWNGSLEPPTKNAVYDKIETLGGGGITKVHPVEWPINTYMLATRWIGHGYTSHAVSSSASNSNNRGKTTPFLVTETVEVDALALYLVAANAGASAVMRLGIFEDDGTGHPGSLVVDAGTASINATGLKTMTFTPVTLTPGIYHAACAMQSLDTAGTNPTVAGASAGTYQTPDPAPVGSNNMFTFASYAMSGAFASSPTPTVSRSLTTGPFHIWIRRSA